MAHERRGSVQLGKSIKLRPRSSRKSVEMGACTYVDVLGQQVVCGLVLADEVGVYGAAGEGGAKEEAEESVERREYICQSTETSPRRAN